jgi:hypothetical protein
MVASVAEEWEAVNIRVARVVVETDAHLAGSYPTTPTTLSVKVGGVDILSFQTCAPLAFVATSEASDALSSPFLVHEIDAA